MPYYIFTNKETGEQREIFFHMNDEKVYNGDSNDEVGQWHREYTVPLAAVDTTIDPFKKNEFIGKLDGKKETLGSMWDRSKELSEARAAKAGGVDPVKQKYFDNYAKTRRGQRHPTEIKEKNDKIMDNVRKEIKKIIPG